MEMWRRKFLRTELLLGLGIFSSTVLLVGLLLGFGIFREPMLDIQMHNTYFVLPPWLLIALVFVPLGSYYS
jgi:hypothetical protein